MSSRADDRVGGSGERGEMFVISAPSGTGKTTLIHRVMEELAPYGRIEHSVSHTTRSPRSSERQGHDYHFVDEETFARMVEEDRFVEWAEYNGKRYGTSKQEVFPRLERGIDVVADIEVQGAEQVLGRYPQAHGIFVVPPSFEVLEERLRSRGLDASRDIDSRLAVSLWEMGRYELYDYVIINDDLERASRVLAAIILEKRHRLERVEPRVREVLRSFEGAVQAAPDRNREE